MDEYLSPTAMAVARDGKALFVACATAKRLLSFDTGTRRVLNAIPLPTPASGLAASTDGHWLFVTCPGQQSQVLGYELDRSLPPVCCWSVHVGHTAMAPVASPDGRWLYVCNRFNNDVSVVDLTKKEEACRIAVQREPVAADITKDGRFLLVANHLPTGRADIEDIAATVSVIDLAARKPVKELRLPNGAVSLHDLRVSPDGKYAIVSHIQAQFTQSTRHIYRGWMNRNAVTLIELGPMQIYNTILLDLPGKGAANPWGLAWEANGTKFVATHAGTHEISIVDLDKVRAQLPRVHPPSAAPSENDAGSVVKVESAKELPMQIGGRKHLSLASGDFGPRAVVISGRTAYIANYFSDTLSIVDLRAPERLVQSIALGPKRESDLVRKGEFYFHSATICLQGWQSCSSCHPGDARADGLNWDLLNDGVGNPKNTKSLLLAFDTPPAMWLGVRETASIGVRAGLRQILFTKQPETVALAIDAYIKSLRPIPSPYLVQSLESEVLSEEPEVHNNRSRFTIRSRDPEAGLQEDSKVRNQESKITWVLSPSAQRGRRVFMQAGCAACHTPPLYTDLHAHDVGTRASYDRPTDKFVTPTLVELWRTAPFLHDGSAATVRDVLITRNPRDEHGRTSRLAPEEIDDLCNYLLSL